jgi:hypothetical protein
MFLHGWPENWAAFKEIPCTNDKRALAKYWRDVIAQLNLKTVTLSGTTRRLFQT